MRSLKLLKSADVCHDAGALRDPTVQTLSQVADHDRANCPFIGPCVAGKLLGPNMHNCIPLMAQEVAVNALASGSTVEAELRDFRQAPVFSRLGFIDPYLSPNPDDTTTDQDAIITRIGEWAQVLLQGDPTTLAERIDSAHCTYHASFTDGCANCTFARTVAADATEVVRPNGSPQRVPRNQCRCPVLNVGDFCPVHQS